MQRLSLLLVIVLLGCAHGWEGNVDLGYYMYVDCDGTGSAADAMVTFYESVSDSAPSQPPPACRASRASRFTASR